MSLSQYVMRRNAKLPAEVDFEQREDDDVIHTWVVRHNLDRWMYLLHQAKGGKEYVEDEMRFWTPLHFIVELTARDLAALEIAVRDDLLSDEGEDDEDNPYAKGEGDDADDLEAIRKARAALAEGASLYYSQWW